jgi:glycosyltransferase involved in cell wall biosynthesis
MSAPRFDVTIHGPLAAPLYVNGAGGASGGAELQTFHLARALADRGLRVCHVVKDTPGLPDRSHGVELVRQPIEHSQTVPQYTRAVLGALRRADAHVYVQRTSGFETGAVGLSARARGRRFVFASSSTLDTSGGGTDVSLRNRWGRQVGLSLANAIVVQSGEQRDQLPQKLAAKARVIRSFASVPSALPEGEREAFLWIGGLIDYKDPDAFVALAERLPEARFWMVATVREGHESTAKRVEAAAARTPNLEVISPRPRSELLELYERSVALVNTSLFEGFPNTFLEAWAHGAPALSLRVDPDSMIEGHELGHCAHGSLDELADHARTLWSERGDWCARRSALREHVVRTHGAAAVADDWVSLLRDMTGSGPALQLEKAPA